MVTEGDRIGEWTLLAELGEGGNAIVWRAQCDAGTVAALKILKNHKPSSEAYRRFRDEIALLRNLSPQPGVLPLIEASLPSRPTRRDPAWLAMPEAMDIRTALGDRPALETVVEAVATIGETLEALAERGVYHRDVKPSNLYRYDQTWVIGDFGLAEFPDKEELTRDGQKLGPAHFLAPEMILRPETAQPGPADVYALAKTLWVLATTERWPPPGEIRLDEAQLRLGTRVANRRAGLLDSLLAQATKNDPELRPSMTEFAADLRDWLAPPRTPAALPTVTDLAARIRVVEAAPVAEGKAYETISQAATRALEGIKDYLAPINLQLQEAIPRWGTYDHSEIVFNGLSLGQSNAVFQTGWAINRETETAAPLGHVRIGFWVAVGVEALPSGRLHLVAAYAIEEKPLGFDVVWESAFTEVPDTAAAEYALTTIGSGLAENLRPALERFVRWIEAPYRLPLARSHLGAARGADRRIYVVGGQRGSHGSVATAEAYDPHSESWEELPPMPTPRLALGVVCGGDGRIYAVGGEGGGVRHSTVEAYNPSTRIWEAVAALPALRSDVGAARCPDGRIVVIGGLSGGPRSAISTSVEAYDPVMNRWTSLAPMPHPRRGAGVTTAEDGRIFVIGGWLGPNGTPTDLVEVYDPQRGTWSEAPAMPTARSWLAAARGKRGRIYAIGGHNPEFGGTLATVEICDPETEGWMPGTPLRIARNSFAAAAGADGKIYVIGGPIDEIPAFDVLEVLD